MAPAYGPRNIGVKARTGPLSEKLYIRILTFYCYADIVMTTSAVVEALYRDRAAPGSLVGIIDASRLYRESTTHG